MKMTESELSGYIDVKVPPKGRKFGPWKAWRKQWCTIKISSGNSVVVALGNSKFNVSNLITVPENANICRSESRTKSYAFGVFLPESKYRQAVVFLAGNSETESQKWMAQIRALLRPNILPVLSGEFSVSLIDNKNSRCAGLYGTYGILSMNSIDMAIRHPNNGEISVTWKWSQIEYAKLVIPTQNEIDNEKILIINLASSRHCNSKNDDYELQLYCESAIDLQLAISRYRSARQHRLMTSPLPPTPVARHNRLHSARRLSRSEGDLRWPLEALPAFQHIRSRSGSRDRNTKTILEDQEVESSSLGRIAKTLISASFGLMLSTPGCSEPDTSHDYQEFSTEDLQLAEYQNVDSESDDLPELRVSFQKACSNRRVSGASIASGIYEEIEEQPTEYYENLSKLKPGSLMDPPPLPPRKADLYNRILEEKSDTVKKKGSQISEKAPRVDKKLNGVISEPDYLPMSPVSLNHHTDDTYVVMENLIRHKKIIVSEPVPI